MEKRFDKIPANEGIGTLTIKTPAEDIQFGFGAGGDKTLDLTSTFNFQEKFIGNFNSFQDVPEDISGFQQLGFVNPRKNFYIIVQNDENNEGKLTRYVYSGENDQEYSKWNWTYQYSIYTPTQFTAQQQEAIDSGITANKVSEIESNSNLHGERLDNQSTRLYVVEEKVRTLEGNATQ